MADLPESASTDWNLAEASEGELHALLNTVRNYENKTGRPTNPNCQACPMNGVCAYNARRAN